MKISLFRIALFSLILNVVAHTSMVQYDMFSGTSMKDIIWLRVILSIVMSASIDFAVMFYIDRGVKWASGINAVFASIIFFCSVKPFSSLQPETYLSIAEIVFALGIGINMFMYSLLSAKDQETETEASKKITELEEANESLSTYLNQLDSDSKKLLTELNKIQIELNKSVTDKEKLQTEFTELQAEKKKVEEEFTKFHLWTDSELKAKDKKFEKLEQSITCQCGYVASLAKHQEKCIVVNPQSPEK